MFTITAEDPSSLAAVSLIEALSTTLAGITGDCGKASASRVAYRLKFSLRALREVGGAYEWYETQSPGLGSEFELAFELQLKRLIQVPLL